MCLAGSGKRESAVTGRRREAGGGGVERGSKRHAKGSARGHEDELNVVKEEKKGEFFLCTYNYRFASLYLSVHIQQHFQHTLHTRERAQAHPHTTTLLTTRIAQTFPPHTLCALHVYPAHGSSSQNCTGSITGMTFTSRQYSSYCTGKNGRVAAHLVNSPTVRPFSRVYANSSNTPSTYASAYI